MQPPGPPALGHAIGSLTGGHRLQVHLKIGDDTIPDDSIIQWFNGAGNVRGSFVPFDPPWGTAGVDKIQTYAVNMDAHPKRGRLAGSRQRKAVEPGRCLRPRN